MKRRITLCLLAALVISGCQLLEQRNNGGAKVFTATIEDNIETLPEANCNVPWNKGAKVSIFAGRTTNLQYEVTKVPDETTDASVLEIVNPESVTGEKISNNVAFYPYSEIITIVRSERSYILKNIVLPETQNYAAESFGKGSYPMTAVTSSTADTELRFKNVLGGLMLQLRGAMAIASISITGNNSEILCGEAEVTVSDSDSPAIKLTDATAKTVTLVSEEGVHLSKEKATPFIIALPPITLSGGFTIVVTDTAGATMEIKSTEPLTIKRASLTELPEVIFEGVPVVEYQYVDLGLPSGLKWATCNVGATAPEEYGDYFAWGETKPYYTEGHSLDRPCKNWRAGKTGYNWESYKFERGDNHVGPFSKYVTKPEYGEVDGKTILDPEDDAAHINWGANWRMPTYADFAELMRCCTVEGTTQNKVNGVLVTGPNGNSIFLPAAGSRMQAERYDSGRYGGYYSSSLISDSPGYAWFFFVSLGETGWGNADRFIGKSVRAVTE
ncbi:MAG: hypothetical protein J5693_03440 [Bacteroidales bacterium]|nr:hypothetical protein [Bacteroidales bacterium]